ncbi:hypothetical protein DPMN_069023 [Dreissena polymorpha]|uniref:Uncharacterized protein n=1 Tax=Dreissena polymorpha TaxID=45954 RepID=A0A9D3Z3H5_DREPO|nr:hypothetical protein DPMN_069023 [Dreissena polymorpha]
MATNTPPTQPSNNNIAATLWHPRNIYATPSPISYQAESCAICLHVRASLAIKCQPSLHCYANGLRYVPYNSQ